MIRPPVEKYTRIPKAHDRRFHDWVIKRPCCVPDCNVKSILHHVTVPPLPIGSLQKSGHRRSHKWGAGLCEHHHTQFHDVLGTVNEFEKVFNVNLDKEAEKNYLEYWT